MKYIGKTPYWEKSDFEQIFEHFSDMLALSDFPLHVEGVNDKVKALMATKEWHEVRDVVRNWVVQGPVT